MPYHKGSYLSGFVLLLPVLTVPIGAFILFMAGSFVIRDADGAVGGVLLTDSVRTVAARRFPGGVYATTAQLEGEAVVRCRNGHRVSFGYITGGIHIWRTVRTRDCTADRVIN
ncbi:hypothetical protein GCM10023232_08210 [Sphingosinicella ginsenosidimutans]|uniref:Uncharacterized protein n=1 Tax=Allosphingosinicella ginsenosidimutans TaxID=1176539 RepID=A0A5C6TY15_9SPHN|nr:hypothetical protein [Sphingosinicella ginsenosidimutans]TXC64638.1 hypothetical protein FRZ32_13850 [Sphingosinicella ginsenosidimutans]